MAEAVQVETGHSIDLDILAVADPKKVAEQRRRLDDADLYGERVCVLTGDLLSIQLPPYLAHLIICEDLAAASFGQGQPFVEKLFHSLRPYGGVACLNLQGKG